ncbi:MAG: CHASE domain-containing protein [Magnetococcales bacterium]|nr:CHASE domain-containing protein [Magnetococcales bacterium]
MGKRKVHLVMILTVVMGVMISWFLYDSVYQQELGRIRAEFTRDVDERSNAIRSEIALAFGTLHGLRGLFNASTHVDRHEFRAYSEWILKQQLGVQALEWVPKVPLSRRDHHERQAINDGLIGFEFTERGQQGKVVRAGERAHYYPIYYVEPPAGSQTAIGFDLASNPALRASMEDAHASGELFGTAPIDLVQESGTKIGMLAFLPVYDYGPYKQAGRTGNLSGYVFGVFRIGDIVSMALKRVSAISPQIQLEIFDVTMPGSKRLIHHQKPANSEIVDSKLVYHTPLSNLGGRSWLMVARPSEAYLAQHQSHMPVMAFVAGLLITLLVGLYLGSVATRSVAIEALIQKRTEELSEQEIKNRTIVETTVNGLITINGRGVVESFNPAAEKMFGYEAHQVIGHNISMLMPEPYHSAHDGYLKHYGETGHGAIIGVGREVQGRRQDGSIFPIYLSVGEQEVKGKKTFVGFIVDITQQKEAERLKSEFVSTVSHELRTPLTSIKGMLGLVLGGVVGELTPKATEMLNKAMENTNRLTLLINDILDMEKIQSGRMAFDCTSIPLGTFLQQALSSNQGYGEKFKVSLRLENPPSDGKVIYGDANRLHQVLSNLISNAIKFSSEQGEVLLTIEELGEMTRISVTDHGLGIPEAFRGRIFHKFAQADGSNTRNISGTGLGLAISKTIIEQHGGRIGFDSVEGEGSVFHIDLPNSCPVTLEQKEI